MIRAASKTEQVKGSYHDGYQLIKSMDKSINRAVGSSRQTNKVPSRQGRGVDAWEPAIFRRVPDLHHRVNRHGEYHRRRDQRFSPWWECGCHITATRRFSLCNL